MKVTTVPYSNQGAETTMDGRYIDVRFQQVTDTSRPDHSFPNFGGTYKAPPYANADEGELKAAALIAANLHEFLELIRFDGAPIGFNQHDARQVDHRKVHLYHWTVAREKLYRVIDLAIAMFKEQT